MKETWRQQMQQKLADYEEPAPELSWEEIEQAVKPKVIPFWGRRIAAAAAILLISGAAVLYLRQRETAPESEAPTSAIPSIIETPQQRAEEPQQIIQQTMVTHMRQQNLTAMNPSKQTIASEPEAEPVQQQEASAEAPTDTTMQQTYTQYDTYTSKPNSSPQLLTAKLFFSNSMTGGQTLMSNTSKNQYSTPISQIEKYGHDYLETNADIQQSEQVRHHLPIRFGLLLRYQLSNRWALESGLTYTRLTAEITRILPGKTATTIDQSLNYIGIPLTANYLIYNSRHFGFYASAGMLVEKMVYGSRTESGSTQRVIIHPLQLSVNGGFGAEYKFTPALSLFLEPGLTYYFDNGSTIPTSYQETPLNFNLNLGLRISFE